MTESLDANEGKSRARPSARPLFKDIYVQFNGHADLLGLYSVILAEVAYGEYTVPLRKKQKALPSEFITTLSRLVTLLGKDKRRIKRELAVLVEMGVIAVEDRGKHCLVITNTNTSKKSAEESSANIPKARQTNSGKCHDSDKRIVANATIREFPSLLDKKKGEEEILIRREREEEEGFCDFEKEENAQMAESWHLSIRQKYSGTLIKEADLIKIVDKCRQMMIKINMEPTDLLDVIWCAEIYGTALQKNMIFKAPKNLLIPDDFGHTFFEEICDVFKDKKMKIERKIIERARYQR